MLIITDLDDTLLKEGNIISEYTKSILKKAQDQNHIIVYNTARGLNPTLPVYNEFKPDYLILNGGSSIYNKNLELIYEKRIDLNDTLNIISYLKDHNINDILVECGKGFIVEEDNLSPYAELKLPSYANLTEGALKIVFKADTNKEAIIIANKYKLDMTTYVGGILHKISPNTKAIGNQILLKILNNGEKTICFGDDLGDIDMLKEADMGVKMKNSQPQVMELNLPMTEFSAKEDGVAKYIEKYILK